MQRSHFRFPVIQRRLQSFRKRQHAIRDGPIETFD
ncbi:hypothetical protein X739_10500 [Mesorhizobium sp. LNHC220B00]|nr:hypothetical protein X739_10500 [Mesorhizobium sp. LNHC220B00]ESY95507.1 hypothetical protein X741_10065 [Mesorhizobium sp. LNHC229A00]ESY99031.1 hypothetical protein X738_14565 [Mesorhizobium sp. LNHC209A00]